MDRTIISDRGRILQVYRLALLRSEGRKKDMSNRGVSKAGRVETEPYSDGL